MELVTLESEIVVEILSFYAPENGVPIMYCKILNL